MQDNSQTSGNAEVECGIGGGAAADTQPREAPGVDVVGPAIMPGAPNKYWWKRPIYETAQWWQQHGWMPPPTSGNSIISGVGVAIALALLFALRSIPDHVSSPDEFVSCDPDPSLEASLEFSPCSDERPRLFAGVIGPAGQESEEVLSLEDMLSGEGVTVIEFNSDVTAVNTGFCEP